MILSLCKALSEFPSELHLFFCLDVYLQYSNHFLISISPEAR